MIGSQNYGIIHLWLNQAGICDEDRRYREHGKCFRSA